jgi:hypothetical protein
MIKTIWILWFQGFENAPEVVKTCLKTWKKYNKDWDIIELDNSNLKDYIKIDEVIDNFNDKKISLTHQADIIRIYLLKKYGGIWVDSTLYCNRPLNEWIFYHIDSGFFAFNKCRGDRLQSSWFMYSEKNNLIVSIWLDKIIEYFKINNEVICYFMFQYMFNNLYYNNIEFKKIWDKTKKL